MDDGHDLRQMAEMGLAVVALDYDQTNLDAFPAQWAALLEYVGRQPWADPGATAWVGFGLGADQTLAFVLDHPDQQPRLLAQVSGTGLAEGGTGRRFRSLHGPVLLIHGGKDELSPATDTVRFAAALQSNGLPVTLRVLAGAGNGLGPDRGLAFRSVGEWCLSGLAGPNAWRNYHSLAQWTADAPPLWPYLLPALAAAGMLGCRIRAARRSAAIAIPESQPSAPGQPGGCQASGEVAEPKPDRRTGGEIALRVLAIGLAAWALAESALHLLTPRFPVSRTTLSLARRVSVQPGERADFDYLAAQPVWTGIQLKTLLDQVQLAGYNRRLVNWTVDDMMYREDILSPFIPGEPAGKWNWRRPLWEEFYPRIRHESDPAAAAQIIVRHLRERVTIVPGGGSSRDVSEIWRRQLTDPAGFAVIYTAALRSAGVAARLRPDGQVEFWNGNNWQTAPAPAIVSW